MVLDKHRKEADGFLTPVARRLIGVNPNTISWLGLIVALFSGIALYFSWEYNWLLIVGACLVLLSGYFDALDGKIAKLSGKCSVKGDYLDHVFDRYADVFMIGAIAFSGWCHSWIGLLAIIGVLLTSYMGTQAQAVGAARLYDGLLGRADRVVLCVAVPLVEYLLICLGYGSFSIFDFQTNLMDLMMVYFAVMGNFTAVQRVVKTWKNLGS